MSGDATEPSLLQLALTKVKDKGPLCSIKALLQGHPELAAQINELLASHGKNGSGLPFSVIAETLSDAFRRESKPLDGATVSRHVQGRCSCQ